MKLLTLGLTIFALAFSVPVMAKEDPYRNRIINICTKDTVSKTKVTEKQAKGYCSCNMDRLEATNRLYPSLEDQSTQAYYAALQKNAQDCATKNGVPFSSRN